MSEGSISVKQAGLASRPWTGRLHRVKRKKSGTKESLKLHSTSASVSSKEHKVARCVFFLLENYMSAWLNDNLREPFCDTFKEVIGDTGPDRTGSVNFFV